MGTLDIAGAEVAAREGIVVLLNEQIKECFYIVDVITNLISNVF
jgi:hypothetical protein